MTARRSLVERYGIRTEALPETEQDPMCIGVEIDTSPAGGAVAFMITDIQAANLLAMLAWHLHRTELR